jgi:methionine-rich copper-binding protein CopC
MTTTTTARSAAFAVAAAAILGWFAAAPRTAEAHAEYERSLPAAGAVVRAAPELVEIWFTQELFRRAGANTITVEGEAGPVDAGAPVLDDADRTHLSVQLASELPPGEYTVRWTSLSAVDGDSAEGTFTFRVDPTAPEGTATGAETATEMPTEVASATATTVGAGSSEPGETSSGSGGGSAPWWAVIAAASIVASGALGAWAVFRTEAEDGSS